MSVNLIHPVVNITVILPDGISLEIVEVVGGAILMGSDKVKSEQPIHEVNVPAFYIGIYPITNIQFAAFLNAYGSEKVKQGQYSGELIIHEHEWGIRKAGNKWLSADGYAHHPVINVSWYGSTEFCNWLSELTGKLFRLPSESEWEYAARGGQQSLGFVYSGGNKLKEVGWFALNSHGETKPVGLKQPNELGIHDISGNVFEWCADDRHENYESAPDDDSAWVSVGNPEFRTVCGGSWDERGVDNRGSSRFRNGANYRNDNLGFRVARY